MSLSFIHGHAHERMEEKRIDSFLILRAIDRAPCGIKASFEITLICGMREIAG